MPQEVIVTDQIIDKSASLLEDLIRIDTTYGNEHPALDLLRDRFRGIGCEVEMVPFPEGLEADPLYSSAHTRADVPRNNLVVRLPGLAGGKRIILNTHVDVVPASGWQDAFSPHRADGMIRGRGAADAKGQIATMFALASAYREAQLMPRGDIIMQIVIDEEIGGNGTLALLRDGHKGDAAIVMEPTGNSLRCANRGAVWFRAELEGRSVHMSRMREGVSAVTLVIELAYILQKYEDRLVKESKGQPLFKEYPRPAQVNIGKVTAGDWPSSVPGCAVVEGGVGFLPNKSLDAIKRELEAFIQKKAGMWLRSHYRLEFTGLKNEAFETPITDSAVQSLMTALERNGLKGTPLGLMTSCDARLFAIEAGIPTIVFGPGDLAAAHSHAEELAIKDIRKAAEVLIMFVDLYNA